MKKIIFSPIGFFILVVILFFAPFLFLGKFSIPSDTIIGLYHPLRDLHAKDYPNGVPFKNFLITDPVRQQYPWRRLAVNLEKRFELPLWNPYNSAGTPLLANFQSAVFYPLNILLLFLPFAYGWSILILLQPFLAGTFLYFYLRNLRISQPSCLLGGFTFAFCGFSIAWLEWGTVGHTALWLPLVLLSIDKVLSISTSSKISNFKFLISNNKIRVWSLIFILSIVCSFFAGHLQTFFYLYLLSSAYFFARWWMFGKIKKTLPFFLILNSCFLILTAIQWLPTLQFILHSARSVDLNWHKEGWFIPWQHLIQFVAPDFFGNPTTLNYWGIWNYAEFVGYIGVLPLILSLFALFYRRDKKTLFFGTIFFLSLIFSLPTIFAKLPYLLQILFLSTAQPTRLLFLTNFSLSVLAALGSDLLIRGYKIKKIIFPLLFFVIILSGLWIFVLFAGKMFDEKMAENLSVAKRNLYFPTLVFSISAGLLLAYNILSNKKVRIIIIYLLLAITVFDLLRFANKFTPFTKKEYLFPSTKAVEFLQKQNGEFRIMTTDDRILPPNFSIIYNLQSVDGYDPLYLLRYGELISAIERNNPDISPPFGFNRIITPHNFESRIIDLMGVSYILSLSDIKSSKLDMVFVEGQTKVYRNNSAFFRAFLVKNIKPVTGKQEAIDALFDKTINLRDTAVVEDWNSSKTNFASGSASIVEYKEGNISVSVRNDSEAFLVLMDTFYPTWSAKICSKGGEDCEKAKIYLTNYNFRGVKVPKGEHKVVLENTLL